MKRQHIYYTSSFYGSSQLRIKRLAFVYRNRITWLCTTGNKNEDKKYKYKEKREDIELT